MCIVGLSESGHGGRFEPCEECKRLQAEVENLKRKRIEDAGLHERDLALNEYKLRNDDLCERRANQLHKLILAILSGKEAEFIGELEETRDRYFHLGMKQSNKIAALEADNAALRQERARIVEKADALAREAIKEIPHFDIPWVRELAQAYQEARHAK